MDEAVRAYIEAIPPGHRPLFDRLHRLVLGAYPDATVTISYQMPTYRIGRRRLYLATWKHGVSIYGWSGAAAAGFLDCHPELKSSKGTIRLRPDDTARIADDELLALVHAALGG